MQLGLAGSRECKELWASVEGGAVLEDAAALAPVGREGTVD